MANTKVLMLLGIVATQLCLGAEVETLEGSSVTNSTSGGQVTLPALEDEITRARAAEQKLQGDLATEVTARQQEDQSLLKKTEDSKTLIAAQVSAHDKLASDTAAQIKTVADAAQKNTDDRATEKSGLEAKIKANGDNIAAEKASLEGADTSLKRALETKISSNKQTLQDSETKANEKAADEKRHMAKRDREMASSIRAVNDGLQTEQRDRKTLLDQQGALIAALNKKVEDLTLKVSQQASNSAQGAAVNQPAPAPVTP